MCMWVADNSVLSEEEVEKGCEYGEVHMLNRDKEELCMFEYIGNVSYNIGD